MPVSWLLDLEMLSALLCLYCSYLYSHADKRWVPFFAFLRITSKSRTCIIIFRNYIPRARDFKRFCRTRYSRYLSMSPNILSITTFSPIKGVFGDIRYFACFFATDPINMSQIYIHILVE